MDDTVYREDFYSWTQEQASALRAFARDRTDLPNTLDLENIAEEIESLGRSDLDRVESLILRLFQNAIKLSASIQADPARGWRKEIHAWKLSLARKYAPGMRRNLDLDLLWRDARQLAEQDLSEFGEDMLVLPDCCPISLERLLERGVSADDLAAEIIDAVGRQS